MEKEKYFQGQNEQRQTEWEALLNSVPSFDEYTRKYASKSTTKHFSEAIWSGNLSDELIGLFQRV